MERENGRRRRKEGTKGGEGGEGKGGKEKGKEQTGKGRGKLFSQNQCEKMSLLIKFAIDSFTSDYIQDFSANFPILVKKNEAGLRNSAKRMFFGEPFAAFA